MSNFDTKIKALNFKLSVAFNKHWDAVKLDEIKEFAMWVPSDTDRNVYPWLSAWPEFRAWSGSRTENELGEGYYELANKDYESTVKINANLLDDNKSGLYTPVPQVQAIAARKFLWKNIIEVLKNNPDCYDSKKLFATNHPYNPKVDGSGTATTVANVITRSSDTGANWYVLACGEPIKPLILQERQAIKWQTDKAKLFDRNLLRWGGHGRYAFGPTFWQLAVKSNEDLSEDNLRQAIEMQEAFKLDGGSSMDIRSTHLFVPTSLRFKAQDLLEKDVISGSTNSSKGLLKLVSSGFFELA